MKLLTFILLLVLIYLEYFSFPPQNVILYTFEFKPDFIELDTLLFRCDYTLTHYSNSQSQNRSPKAPTPFIRVYLDYSI